MIKQWVYLRHVYQPLGVYLVRSRLRSSKRSIYVSIPFPYPREGGFEIKEIFFRLKFVTRWKGVLRNLISERPLGTLLKIVHSVFRDFLVIILVSMPEVYHHKPQPLIEFSIKLKININFSKFIAQTKPKLIHELEKNRLPPNDSFH